MRIGAQLYTVRDFCRTTEAFAETLKRIADIGYQTVQVSGTCSYEAEWLRDQLQANSLQCVLTHIPSERIIAEPEKVAREHDLFDCKYVGLGYYRYETESPEGTPEAFAAKYGDAARALRENGKYFMIHNHDSEFLHFNGKTALERICELIPAEDAGITLDTYWVQVGGADPALWLERLAGRVPCIHLKDCGYHQRMEVLGEGNLNFDRIFQMAEKAGTEYMLVEQDDCNGEDPFDCLKRSYDFLTANGFR